MRVLTYEYDSWVDPARVFAFAYAGDQHAVWLDSGSNAQEGLSLMGAGTRTAVLQQPDDTHIEIDGVAQVGDILDFIERDLGRWAVPAVGIPLGWMGWLGYEYRHRTVGTPVSRRAETPAAAFLFVDRGIFYDHQAQAVRVVALGAAWTGELLLWRERMVGILRAVTESALTESECAEGGTAGHDPGSAGPVAHLRFAEVQRTNPDSANPASTTADSTTTDSTVRWQFSDAEYVQRIHACQEAIAAGEAYQLCLTMGASMPTQADPVEVFLRLRQHSPAPHSAFIRFGAWAVLSASPERFLKLGAGGVLECEPIKGTRPRRADPEADRATAEELRRNVKERAENVMIVDLMRNDLGQVARLGSVHVPSLLRVESYAQVHQLVSTVRAILADEHTVMDAVRACFPAGSMTGAPKRRATEFLDSVEERARGIYSGALGYFAADGSADLAMVIRAIVMGPDGAHLGAGGGITALSVPGEELAEVKLKAAALIAAVASSPSPQRS